VTDLHRHIAIAEETLAVLWSGRLCFWPIARQPKACSAKHKMQALKAGADAHFTKPVSMNELIAVINRYLG
jgi:hypothetical protein